MSSLEQPLGLDKLPSLSNIDWLNRCSSSACRPIEEDMGMGNCWIEGRSCSSSNSCDTHSNGPVPVKLSEQNVELVEQTEPAKNFQEKISEELPKILELVEPDSTSTICQIEVTTAASAINKVSDLVESTDEHKSQEEDVKEISTVQDLNVLTDDQAEKGEPTCSDSPTSDEVRIPKDYSESSLHALQHEDAKPSVEVHENDVVSKSVEVEQQITIENDVKEQQCLSSGSNSSDVEESALELEKLKKDMKMMEIALQGAARQAQWRIQDFE